MKQRLNTLDILSLVNDFQRLVNMRVNNVYDGNNPQIYFIKLNNSGCKELLYIESGARMNTTSIEFSIFRNTPSSFAGKLRKHLKNKRIAKIRQIGNDRLIEFQFGEGDYCNYLIFEFHSSGNIILTDKEYKILSQRRHHIYDDENKFYYPIKKFDVVNENELNPINMVIDKHMKGNTGKLDYDDILSRVKSSQKGYIIKNNDKYTDFTPFIFEIHKNLEYDVYENFSLAVDAYFTKNNPSKLNHKLSVTQVKKKKQLGKNERKEGHLKSQVYGLEKKTEKLLNKAQIIEENMFFIDTLIKKFQYFRAESYTTKEIYDCIKTDFSEINITKIDFKDQYFTIVIDKISIDIYFNETSYDNISRYHSLKKHSSVKHKKAKEILDIELSNTKRKEVKIIKRPQIEVINRTYWFETYHWFLSNDGFLVICGKNAEQNETICKKYLEKNDIYVHADFHGSGSCVIKSKNKQIPISTIEQAGTFVLCFSKAWQSNVSDKSYYVNADQVSKTAPTGEYLSTGSMMVRGKKNYLSMSYLELSVGIVFKIEGKEGFKITLDKEDKVVECKAMIAPTKTLTNAKYKVKVVPGQTKRNKMLEGILSRFRYIKSVSNEYDYVFAIKKPDLDSLIPQKSKKI